MKNPNLIAATLISLTFAGVTMAKGPDSESSLEISVIPPGVIDDHINELADPNFGGCGNDNNVCTNTSYICPEVVDGVRFVCRPGVGDERRACACRHPVPPLDGAVSTDEAPPMFKWFTW